jgi:hypothetical protein
MTTTEYRVSEISAASPDMSDEEFKALKEDIRNNGQMVPIWKAGEEIIDGRKRLRACQELGIEPQVIDVTPGQDPVALSYSLNILRTHYTIGQRAMVGARRSNLPHGTNRFTKKPEFGHLTGREAAAQVGVAHSQITDAKEIIRRGAPEVAAAVEAGKLTLHAAKQIIYEVPEKEQSTAVERVLEVNSGQSRSTPIAKVLGTAPVGFKRSPKKPLQWRVERGLDQLDNAISMLEDFIAEGVTSKHPHVSSWLKHLSEARSHLSKILNGHKGA